MASFAPEDLLWVKLEGYPWWPAKALSDEYLVNNPNPSDDPNTMAILFFGSNDLGFIDRSDSSVVVPFDSNDHEKCIECSTDSTLSAALEAALEHMRGGGGGEEKDNDGGDASSASSDDEDGDDLLLGIEGGETEEERKARRKKEKKEKKKDKKDKKKDKKDKKDKKKDKKEKRRSEDDDNEEEYGDAGETPRRNREKISSSGREAKRSRAEKSSKKSSGGKHHHHNDDLDDGAFDYAHYDEDEHGNKPIAFEKIDVDDGLLLEIKSKLDEAITNRDVNTIRDCFSDLSRVNVTFEQLLSTGVGRSVGLVCDVSLNKEGWDQRFAPLQLWAESIVRYWFSRIPERHKGQLIDAGEVDRASLASNEDAASRHSEDEFNTLNTFGLAIERAFEDAPESSSSGGGDGLAARTELFNDALLSRTVGSYGNLAASSVVMSAAEISLEIQRAVEALDVNHRAQRGAEVLKMLQSAEHSQLREALLRGLLSAKDFVLNPLHSSLTTDEKRELEEAEDEAGKAMDITGEKERIEKAIADAEVLEK